MDRYYMAKWLVEIAAEKDKAIREQDCVTVMNLLAEAKCFNETTLEHYINDWRNSDNLPTETLFNRMRFKGDAYHDEVKRVFEKRGFIDHGGVFYFTFKGKEYVHDLEYPRISDEILKDEYYKWLGTWRYEMAGEGADYDSFAYSKANWHLKKLDKEMAKREVVLDDGT